MEKNRKLDFRRRCWLGYSIDIELGVMFLGVILLNGVFATENDLALRSIPVAQENMGGVEDVGPALASKHVSLVFRQSEDISTPRTYCQLASMR